MKLATGVRAGLALFLACGTGHALSQGFFSDEVSIEPEIINVRALTPTPAAPSQPALLLPRPHAAMHAEGNPAGPHVILGDIPFKAARTSAQTENLWERIRASFGMQELPSPLVRDWENWYSSRPDYVSRMIARSERYLFFIVEEVEKRGMPSEIALLPMIESAFNPTAYSTAHASGIWQFIPSTGKNYGLKQNWWQDERRDVLAATRAALDYLEKLYEMFGSWELALASYNWGEGAVGRAIQRNEARGMRTDYLSLDMPAETRNYLPKLMAVKNLIARPESFNLTLAEIRNRPYFTVVSTDRHIDVKLAARFAEMSVEEFQALNPSHNRPVIRAETTQPILLPADRADRFQANLEAHGDQLVSWQSYTIGRQESLDQIAQRFGIATPQLREVNSISNRIRNLVGLTILVPAGGNATGGDISAAGFAAPAPAVREPTVAASAAAATHVVRAGETLSSIAQRYRLSVAQLATRNGIRNGRVLAGQTLTIGEVSARTAARPVQATQSASASKVKAAPVRRVAQTKAAPAAKSDTKAVKTSAGRTQVAYANRRD